MSNSLSSSWIDQLTPTQRQQLQWLTAHQCEVQAVCVKPNHTRLEVIVKPHILLVESAPNVREAFEVVHRLARYLITKSLHLP
ncbi:hypothetical protein [Deinococcus peraridilitoris]|uniref:hypothetical protein n=1 Tax=Deinococcus peraridilitoris TaxID=432329 RepID=UPI0012F827C9|nr:hypothetical protein [Deinococcus peraridilitoris]